MNVFRVGGVQHALCKSHDVVLHLLRHLPAPMVLEAVRAVEVASHRGADGQADPPWETACSASHGFKCGALVEFADDAAFGEALDDGVVLVELLQDGKQVHLYRGVFGAIAFEEVGDGHHLAVRYACAQVVARHMPTGLACRPSRLGLSLLIGCHDALLSCWFFCLSIVAT